MNSLNWNSLILFPSSFYIHNKQINSLLLRMIKYYIYISYKEEFMNPQVKAI